MKPFAPNYAIDESWARVDPYGSEARDRENVTLRLRILNHAPQRETYHVKWNVVSLGTKSADTPRALFRFGTVRRLGSLATDR